MTIKSASVVKSEFAATYGITTDGGITEGGLLGDTNDLIDSLSSGQINNTLPAFNAKDPQWGIAGDGVTDDAAALNAFFLAAHNKGNLVILPALNYAVSNTVTFGREMAVYCPGGGGFSATFIALASSNWNDGRPMVRLDNDADRDICHGLQVNGLNLECEGRAAIGFQAFSFQEASFLDSCQVFGFTNAGYYFKSTQTNSWNVCENFSLYRLGSGSIQGSTPTGSSTSYCLYMSGCSGRNVLESMSLQCNSSSTPGTGVYVEHGFLHITGLHCEQCTDGVKIGPVGWLSVRGITGHSSVTNLVHILNTASNVSVDELSQQGASIGILDDNFNSAPLSSGNETAPSYRSYPAGGGIGTVFTSPNSGQPALWALSNGLNANNNLFGAGSTYPTTADSSDVFAAFYNAQSATWVIKNGNPFLQLVRTYQWTHAATWNFNLDAGLAGGAHEASIDVTDTAGTIPLRLQASGGQVILGGPTQPAQFTLATLPSAASYTGSIIFVTDHTTGTGLCVSNGTHWIDVTTGNTVS